jgi:putative zinc finger/helix-turn-helix YgiT family protein
VTELMRTPEPFPWLCSRCGAEKVLPEKIAYETTVRYEGRDYRVIVPELPALRCQDCGETLLNNESDADLSRAFRDKLKLLQPENIREARKRLNLNQREFAEVLGVAEESVSRWETGAQMQSRVVDKIMRVYFASPEAREVLDAARTDAGIGASVVTTEVAISREETPDWPDLLTCHQTTGWKPILQLRKRQAGSLSYSYENDRLEAYPTLAQQRDK